ncbi:MAG TPA: M24 family metallopeptidase, partial [Actinotalea sp.]|nr:M24 family metallopeptidase [Actinotalea sp.]
MFRRERIEYKTADQVAVMRRAGLVVAAAHDAVRASVAPGVTTAELDEVAAAVIADAGATPSFLGYHGFPAVLCVSVNDEVVHGIPGPRVLGAGDVVSVDCGAVVDGWHGDAAFTVVLDEADPADVALSAATERAMWAAIAALATGERLDVVGEAVEQVVQDAEAESGTPYGIVQEYVEHGIGSA